MPESDSAALAADRALVAAWRRLHAESTPGPWHIGQEATGPCVLRGPHQLANGRSVARVYCEYDAAWIAHAHESTLAERLAARLDELEELKREVARLRGAEA